jgi:hypothetical protein
MSLQVKIWQFHFPFTTVIDDALLSLLFKCTLEYAVMKDQGNHADVKLLGGKINTVKNKTSGLLEANM